MVLVYWGRTAARAAEIAFKAATSGLLGLVRTAFLAIAAAAFGWAITGGTDWQAKLEGIALGIFALFAICFLATLLYVPAEKEKILKDDLSKFQNQKRDIELEQIPADVGHCLYPAWRK